MCFYEPVSVLVEKKYFSYKVGVSLSAFCLFKVVQVEMLGTCCVQLLWGFTSSYSVTESVTMIGVSGEGLLRVCTEPPSGHRFKTAAQDQSQSESSAPLANKTSGESKKE